MKIAVTVKIEVTGMKHVVPCMMLRDQILNVTLWQSADGEIHFELAEVMPPQVNFARLHQPTQADEKATREREWAALERQRFEG